MKWFFHVCMCLYFLFIIRVSGGTRWNSSSSSAIKKEHALSKMCVFGFRPLSLSVFCITLYTIIRSVPYFDFVGSNIMVFESCAYATIIYLHPLTDVTGNPPVWSIYIYLTKKLSPTKILVAIVCEVYLAPTEHLLVLLSAAHSFQYPG